MFMAMTSPLVVCVTVNAGSRMLDSHDTPTTIAAIKGAATAWRRKTDEEERHGRNLRSKDKPDGLGV